MTLLAKDLKGNRFEAFYPEVEEASIMDDYSLLTFSVVVLEHQRQYLLIKNSWRDQWELPGGFIDPGETPRDAAVRETHEETGQILSEVVFLGVIELYAEARQRVEFGALYGSLLKILTPFQPNDEAVDVHLWDGISTLPGYLNEIDAKLVQLYLASDEARSRDDFL